MRSVEIVVFDKRSEVASNIQICATETRNSEDYGCIFPKDGAEGSVDPDVLAMPEI